MRRLPFSNGCMLVCLLLATPGLADSPPNPVVRLELEVKAHPEDWSAWSQLAVLYLNELHVTGDLAQLTKARRAAEKATKDVDPHFFAGGFAARAHVEMAERRFAAARTTAQIYGEAFPNARTGWELLGDAELELGNYPEAKKAYAKCDERSGGSDVETLAGRSKLAVLHGQRPLAQKLLEQALAELSAWPYPRRADQAACLVQMGALAFGEGNWEDAEKHYAAAERLLPGWFPARAHLAELRGAQGRTEEAITAYQALLAQVERPDLCQALGDLYVFAGRQEEAAPWYAKAAAAYHRSLEAGEVLWLHQACSFFTDSAPDPAEALTLAQRDRRLSIDAWDALAWAQYTKGDLKEAALSVEKALSTGVRDAHILYRAGLIRMSVGDLTGGRAALQQTVEINPRYATFHVHR